jgi:hypothetical protein
MAPTRNQPLRAPLRGSHASRAPFPASRRKAPVPVSGLRFRFKLQRFNDSTIAPRLAEKLTHYALAAPRPSPLAPRITFPHPTFSLAREVLIRYFAGPPQNACKCLRLRL